MYENILSMGQELAAVGNRAMRGSADLDQLVTAAREWCYDSDVVPDGEQFLVGALTALTLLRMRLPYYVDDNPYLGLAEVAGTIVHMTNPVELELDLTWPDEA